MELLTKDQREEKKIIKQLKKGEYYQINEYLFLLEKTGGEVSYINEFISALFESRWEHRLIDVAKRLFRINYEKFYEQIDALLSRELYSRNHFLGGSWIKIVVNHKFSEKYLPELEEFSLCEGYAICFMKQYKDYICCEDVFKRVISWIENIEGYVPSWEEEDQYALQNLNKKSNQLNSQNQLLDLLFTSCDIKIKGNLRNVQLLYIELLRFVDNVCKKHDIDYWLEGGTLIGAVRHGGFIPWDDDIDLSIMRKDYEKLIKVLPEEISKYEYFKENCGLSLLIENQKNYFEGFRSVYDVDDENGFLDDNKFSFLQIAWLKPYVKIDLFPKDYVLEEKLESFKKDYVSTKYKFNQEVKNGKKVFWNEFNVVKKELGLVNTKTKYFADSIDVLQLTSDLIYETDKIFPLKTIKFEGYEFKCPKDIKHTLEVQFGKNFMHIPNVIENHSLVPFIEHQFDSVDEMNEAFSKSISYLKEINDNFDFE